MKKIQNSILGAAATLAACSLISAVLLCGCSKDLQEQQASNTRTDAEMCELALTVSCGEATKTDITHEGGATKLDVDWKSGDKLYVIGATDGYLGYVTLSGTVTQTSGGSKATFKGNIKGWNSSQVLRIYYLGDTDPSLSSGAGEYTFDISSQGGTLDWIEDNGHIAHGATASLAPGTKTIATSLTMSNLNAVVLFDLSKWTDGTTISGTYSSAKLNLKKGEFSTKTDGEIILDATACTGGKTYVTFIPDSRALTFKQGSYSTSALANTTEAGCFYSNNGTAIDMPVKKASTVLLSGKFSVSGTKQVNFTKGNLYYSTTDSKYHIEDQQNVTSATLGQSSYNATHVCHFYWSNTTDWETTDEQPWTQTYAYSTQKTSDKFFCGIDNPMTVDGQSGLYALTGGSSGEWNYLLNTRSVNGGTGEGKSYQRATINNDVNGGVYGMIIYPDNYTSQTSATSYTSSEWTAMENAGCVFLPTAGNRRDSSLFSVGSFGYYWSSSPDDSWYASDIAYSLYFYSGNVYPAYGLTSRYYGCSVRLVCAAQ